MNMLYLSILLACSIKVQNPTEPPKLKTEALKGPDLDRYLLKLTNNNQMNGSFVSMRQGEVLFQKAYGSLDAKGVNKANTETPP